MEDPTEKERRSQLYELNRDPRERTELEKQYGRVWDTQELGREFEVLGFMAPYVVVRRRADGAKGSLMFQHDPRYYFDFAEDKLVK